MRMVDLIEKKRDGGVLTDDEIRFIIKGFTDGSIPDYQMSAFAMTVFYKGMTDHETAVLTDAMMRSGDTVDLSRFGGTGKDIGKRHPTLGNNVMVGSGAKVLGPFRVGDNARIAANAVVLREVPEGATVVGVPGRIVRLCGDKLDHIHTPDPVMLEIEELKRRMALLEEQINDTKKET